MRKNTLTLLAASSAVVFAAMFNVARAADLAGPADAAPTPHAMHQMHREHGEHGWHGMRDLAKLHDQLKLSPQQEQAWQQALTRMKQNHEAMHKNMAQFKTMMAATKNEKILDLAGMSAQRDKIFDENHRLRSDTEAQWLAVYNGLNDNQKEIVSAAIKARMARMGERHEHMKFHHHPHHAAAPAQSQANPQ